LIDELLAGARTPEEITGPEGLPCPRRTTFHRFATTKLGARPHLVAIAA
jgi:hypothetical protein